MLESATHVLSLSRLNADVEALSAKFLVDSNASANLQNAQFFAQDHRNALILRYKIIDAILAIVLDAPLYAESR